MEKREKLEIPTISFTPVTLLYTGASGCDDPENCTGVDTWTKVCKDKCGQNEF